MTGGRALSVEIEGDLAYVTFDLIGRPVNVWTRDTLTELEDVMTDLGAQRDLAGVVFRSGKPDSFIAGADIDMLADIETPDEARDLALRGQAVFQRVADLSVPTIAAIHGACVGGGLEFALACSFRLASDDAATRFGFPEIQLGILPAWGGTQRTPRLIGLERGLTLILTSRLVDAVRARRMGLVDSVWPAPRLEEAARRAAAEVIGGRGPSGRRRSPRLKGLLLERNPLGRRLVFSQSRKRVRERSGTDYPAPLKAIEVVETGLSEGFEAGLAAEAEAVAWLATTPVSRNLMWLYRQREAACSAPGGVSVPAVQRIGVLGAGVMGGGIAEVAAYHGVNVRLKDLDPQRVSAGLAHAASVVNGLARSGKIDRRRAREVMHRISGTTTFAGFGRVELVIEAIVEDVAIKRRVLAEVERAVAPETVLATNTSSLLVGDLATPLERPERFGGLHFFNPVERMPLVEVVRGPATSEETVATLHQFAVGLGKTPVIVRDGPGFWVNRLLMPYLNEAVSLYAEGVGIARLDAALEAFGLPMGPLALLDEIGLDVAAKVSVVLQTAFPDRMHPHPLLHRLEQTGRLGRKSGTGFYNWKADKRGDPDTRLRQELGLDRVGPEEEAPVFNDATIVSRCLYPMVNEAARALEDEIVATPAEGDLALVVGVGWPPYRGGLLKWADGRGLSAIVDRLDRWAAVIDRRLMPSRALSRRATWDGGFYGAPVSPRRLDDDPQPSLEGL